MGIYLASRGELILPRESMIRTATYAKLAMEEMTRKYLAPLSSMEARRISTTALDRACVTLSALNGAIFAMLTFLMVYQLRRGGYWSLSRSAGILCRPVVRNPPNPPC